MLTSANTSGSLLEGPLPQPVQHFQEQRLAFGLSPAKRVEPDLVPVQVHLGAHQPVRPSLRHSPALSQDVHTSVPVCTPQVDKPTPGERLAGPAPTSLGRPAVGRPAGS